MKRQQISSLLLLAGIFFFPVYPLTAFSSALDNDLSSDITAAEVVAKYLQAIGGIEALKNIETKKIRYRVHMFGRENYLMERYWTRPDLMRQGPPDGAMYTLTEGLKSWRVTPDGRQEMPAAVSANFAKLAYIDDPLVDLEKKGISVEYIGKEQYDMAELHHLKLTFADGVEWDQYFDAGTGLLRKMKQPSFFMLNNEISRGPDAWTYYYDYRPVENLKIPHLWLQVTDDHVHAFVVEEVILNN